MAKEKKSLLEIRAAEKAASRAADAKRLREGVSPEVIQHENDAFKGRFRKAINISNLAEALEQ